MGLSGVLRERLGDLEVPPPQPDPGIGVVKGFTSEQLALGTYTSPGNGAVTAFTLVTGAGGVFVTTNTIHVATRIRTVLIAIPTAVTFAAAQQITATLISGRQQRASSSTAAEQMPDTGTETDKVGAAFNVGTSVASTGPRWFWVTPQEIPQLQWPLEWVGLELNFPVGPTAGAIYVAFIGGPV